MRKLRPHVGDHFYNSPNFGDIAKLRVSEESTESVDRKKLVCRSVALIYVEFWGVEKTGIFWARRKKVDLPVHDPKKGEFLKNGEIWGNFGGVWRDNDKG